MEKRNPKALLQAALAQGKLLCAGVDPPLNLEDLPADVKIYDKSGLWVEETLVLYGTTIIDAAAPYACAIKPNLAFFGQHGEAGWRAIKRLVLYAHTRYPHLVIIADSKRNDIGKTATAYAEEVLGLLAFDGTTCNGSLGWDGVKPFVEYDDASRLIFPLCRTSNPSGATTQDVMMTLTEQQLQDILSGPGVCEEGAQSVTLSMLYYEMTARLIGHWFNAHGNCGAVVGATVPEQMRAIRRILRNNPFIVPGFGNQGGDVMATLEAGLTTDGGGLVCNYSGGIGEAYKKEEYAGMTFAESVAAAAGNANEILRRCRREVIALRIFEKTGAILYGHFVYKSRLHGKVYVAKEKALENHADIKSFSELLAEVLTDWDFDVIVGPADPGTILAEQTAAAFEGLTGRHVGWAYASKAGERFTLKTDQAERVKGKLVAMVDDVANQGTTFKLVKEAIEEAGGTVVVFVSLWNRGNLSGTEAGLPVESLIDREFEVFPVDECPDCAAGIEVDTEHGHGADFLRERAEAASQTEQDQQ